VRRKPNEVAKLIVDHMMLGERVSPHVVTTPVLRRPHPEDAYFNIACCVGGAIRWLTVTLNLADRRLHSLVMAEFRRRAFEVHEPPNSDEMDTLIEALWPGADLESPPTRH
jgi:hypothetical protein